MALQGTFIQCKLDVWKKRRYTISHSSIYNRRCRYLTLLNAQRILFPSLGKQSFCKSYLNSYDIVVEIWGTQASKHCDRTIKCVQYNSNPPRSDPRRSTRYTTRPTYLLTIFLLNSYQYIFYIYDAVRGFCASRR